MALNSLEMATLGLLGPDGLNSLTMATLGLLRPGGLGLDPEGDRGTETPPGFEGGDPRGKILREDDELLNFITTIVTKGFLN